MAGISLCAPLFTALMAIGNIYGQGGSSLISRLLGSGDRDSVGITAALTNIASSVCIVVMNQYLLPLPQGDEKIAALGIVLKITMIVQLILVGFSFGGVPLFGYLYGAENREKLNRLLRFCTLFLRGLALLKSLAVFLLAKPLLRVFMDNAAIVAEGAIMLRWQIAGMVFCAVVLLYACLFQASGKALNALIMSLSRQGCCLSRFFWPQRLSRGTAVSSPRS